MTEKAHSAGQSSFESVSGAPESPRNITGSLKKWGGEAVTWIMRNNQYIPGISQGMALPKMIYAIGYLVVSAKGKDLKGVKASLISLGRTIVSTVPILGNLALLVADTVAVKVFKFPQDVGSPMLRHMDLAFRVSRKLESFFPTQGIGQNVAEQFIKAVKEDQGKLAEKRQCGPEFCSALKKEIENLSEKKRRRLELNITKPVFDELMKVLNLEEPKK